jgi:hypothetical protein
MRKATSKFTTAAGIALAALLGTLSFSGTTSAAEGIRKHNGVSVNTPHRGANRGNAIRNRSVGENHAVDTNRHGRRHGNFIVNRNYSDNDDDYGRNHRRHRGIGFGGVSINLGDIDSSCRYSYRKWQNTGSRYWRSRYYDCVG